jgi:hypothetical protein
MAIEQALEPVGDDFGMAVKVGAITFGSTNCHMKIEFGTVSEDGEIDTKQAVDFRQRAPMYGLESSDLHRTFQAPTGLEYKIIGLNTRSRRYPILARATKGGKTYKFATASVLRYLGR